MLENLSVILIIVTELYTLSDKRVFTKTILSLSVEASLCRREAGEREKWKHGGHHGKRKERKPFSSSYRPPRDCYSFTSVIFIGVPSGSLCDTDSLWWTVLFTTTESVELFILFTYTNATHKYLNRFFSLAERQISQSKNSALFQIHEMCLNKLIIIKIFCGHDNLMPVETRSAFASTSFFLFLSVFLHFLSEQHVFISTCRT